MNLIKILQFIVQRRSHSIKIPTILLKDLEKKPTIPRANATRSPGISKPSRTKKPSAKLAAMADDNQISKNKKKARTSNSSRIR